MITLLLIPFFLLSRISVDIDSLLNGPEYTYRVEINAINDDGLNGEMSKSFDLVNTLKCRPKVPDTLNCRFEAAKIKIYKEGLFELSPETVEDLGTNDEPFEIIFDKKGINHLIVTKDMEPWTIDMIRSIVNQLNVGIDINNIPDGKYTTIEKSYLGETETRVTLNRYGLSDDQWKDDKFEIITINNGIKKLRGEVLELTKRRYFDNIDNKKVYFFASQSAYSKLPPDITTNLKLSFSNIIVSDSNLTSYTTNDIIISNKDKSTNFVLSEKIKLSLEVVSAGKGEIPSITNPTLVSFMIQDHHRDKNEKKRSSSIGSYERSSFNEKSSTNEI